jgi:apolipoprotein N-acyltransferase
VTVDASTNGPLWTHERLQHLCIRYLAGWRLHVATWALGAASVLAFAPFFAWPLLFITLPAWLALVTHAEMRGDAHPRRLLAWRRTAIGRAGEAGWWFGFGYFMAGLFWIGEAFLVEPEIFGWLLPFAVTLLPAGLAFFYAGAMAAAAKLAPPGVHRVLALAVTLSIAEWLRGHILTGFPWNVLGYALTYPLALMQSASVFGIYGMTLIAVIVFAIPGTLLLDREPQVISPVKRFSWLACAVIPLTAMWVFGSVRLAATPAPAPGGAAPVIRIVQPSVIQRDKWRADKQRRIFDDHLALSLQKPDGTPDGALGISMIVWPEAAMPFFPLRTQIALDEIGRMLPDGTTLVSGAMRDEPPGAAGANRRVFNSMIAFGSGDSARILGVYDKIHLVPFGEYLPFSGFLEATGLQNLTRQRGGFATGPEPRPLMDVPGIGRIGPLICYEALFPLDLVHGAERPRLLINVTNDGWFGNTTGPRQHLHQTRVRAVEEGLPIVRAANNGISAVIDPNGRILAQLDLNVRGSLDAALPGIHAAPIYARFGDSVFAVLVMATTCVAAILRRRQRGE